MKSSLTLVIKVFISVLVLWFLTHTAKLDFKLLYNLINFPVLLLFTLSLYFLGVVISAWRWYELNKAQGLPLSFKQTIIPTYLGIAFNNLLPGGVGGDFFRCYALFKKIPEKRTSVMMSILFDRITGLMGIFIAASLVAVLHLNLFAKYNTPFYFILACVIICITALTLFFISAALPQQVGLTTWLAKRFAHKKWLGSITSLLEALRIYRHAKMTILKCLLASVVVQFIIVAICMLLAKMMYFPSISFFDYLIAAAITQIVNLIPIAPGGFGIGEAAFANVLALLNPGVGATYATIFLAYRILGIITYLPGLAVFAVGNFHISKISIHNKTETSYETN